MGRYGDTTMSLSAHSNDQITFYRDIGIETVITNTETVIDVADKRNTGPQQAHEEEYQRGCLVAWWPSAVWHRRREPARRVSGSRGANERLC